MQETQQTVSTRHGDPAMDTITARVSTFFHQHNPKLTTTTEYRTYYSIHNGESVKLFQDYETAHTAKEQADSIQKYLVTFYDNSKSKYDYTQRDIPLYEQEERKELLQKQCDIMEHGLQEHEGDVKVFTLEYLDFYGVMHHEQHLNYDTVALRIDRTEKRIQKQETALAEFFGYDTLTEALQQSYVNNLLNNYDYRDIMHKTFRNSGGDVDRVATGHHIDITTLQYSNPNREKLMQQRRKATRLLHDAFVQANDGNIGEYPFEWVNAIIDYTTMIAILHDSENSM